MTTIFTLNESKCAYQSAIIEHLFPNGTQLYKKYRLYLFNFDFLVFIFIPSSSFFNSYAKVFLVFKDEISSQKQITPLF